MTTLPELIERLCPDGVPFLPLSVLISYRQPTPFLVSSTNYSPEFPTPVLTAGQTFVLGFTDESHGIYPASAANPVVIFDDFTTAFKWVDFPFKAKSSAMKLLTSVNPDLAELRYLYFVMQTIRYAPQEHSRQWIGTYSGFRVPVPPLEVQREIVRILDHFTELEAELEAELDARRLQYAHYLRQVVSTAVGEQTSVGALGKWVGGITPSKSEPRYWENGSVPWLASMDVSESRGGAVRGRVANAALSETSLRIVPAPSVAVVMRSNILRKRLPISLVEVDTTVNQDVRLLHPHDGVSPEYVYYAMRAVEDDLRERLVRTDGSMAAVNTKSFLSWPLTLPSPSDQIKLVEQMRAFDALVNDLSIGLPAELAARRKQYEYYRDKLLTFDEAPA